MWSSEYDAICLRTKKHDNKPLSEYVSVSEGYYVRTWTGKA